MSYLKRFIIKENGSEIMEYIAVLCVAAGIIAIVAGFGDNLKDAIRSIAGSV